MRSAQAPTTGLPILKAVRHFRRLQGGSQPHLILAEDGRPYVVKFTSNPQHRRVLVNEYVGHLILAKLGLSTPTAALVSCDGAFIDAAPGLTFAIRTKKIVPTPGIHFGSQYVGFACGRLMEPMRHRVSNHDEFVGLLTFDKWVLNYDARQCIFSASNKNEFETRLWAIDNGAILGGDQWQHHVVPGYGLASDTRAYQGIRRWSDLEPWLESIRNFSPDDIKGALSSMPKEWIREDENRLTQILELLWERRTRVPERLAETISLYPKLFPNWEG